MAKDPVCNMKVDESKTKSISTCKGKTYYFCSVDCKKALDLNPAKYAKNWKRPGFTYRATIPGIIRENIER